MITDKNTTRGARTFIKAPPYTAFGKVFLKNMDRNDRNSFSSDKEKQLAMMISNGKTAIFGKTYGKIVQMQKYKNCEVLKKLYVSEIYCSLNKLCNMFLDRDGLGNKNGITKHTNYKRNALWNFYEADYY